LFANKFLYPKGGSESHLLGLADALGRRGHDITFFGMQDPRNVTPPDRTTTVPATDYDSRGLIPRVRQFGRMLFSTAAYRSVRQCVERSRPEIAHLHNIYHQLSPSVLVALRRRGVPCVLTAHDYKLVCPSYSLHDGQSQCFACRDHRYWNVLARACSRRGVAGDVALAVEAYAHHFFRVYRRCVDGVIAPSRFLRDRLVEGGYAADRVVLLPNAIAVREFSPNPEPGDYMLFVGRLSYEKGLPTLVDAARQARDVPLWIVGDGPLRHELERQAADAPHVRFLGSRPSAEVRELMRGCRAVVLASVVPENCPLSVLEAFATAKPVIATEVGGVPELFSGGAHGLTVPPGDADSLAAALRQFWSDPDLCCHCGVEARRRAEADHDLEDYVTRIEVIYATVAATGAVPSLESLTCAAADASSLGALRGGFRPGEESPETQNVGKSPHSEMVLPQAKP
jgi:glycosyltransferase involved in cell wall biosynthesis